MFVQVTNCIHGGQNCLCCKQNYFENKGITYASKSILLNFCLWDDTASIDPGILSECVYKLYPTWTCAHFVYLYTAFYHMFCFCCGRIRNATENEQQLKQAQEQDYCKLICDHKYDQNQIQINNHAAPSFKRPLNIQNLVCMFVGCL